MTDDAYACLRVAVALAKVFQVSHTYRLRAMLADRGYDDNTITEALRMWANYEMGKSNDRQNHTQ